MPLIKGSINVQVKVPSIQSEEARDDDKIILVDAETGDTTVITKADFLYPFLYPLKVKENFDNDDSFIGIQPDGNLFRITKYNFLSGIVANGNGTISTRIDSKFLRFIFEKQSVEAWRPSYPTFIFSEQSTVSLSPSYSTFTFSEQSTVSLSPVYLTFIFSEQSTVSLSPDYPLFIFEPHKR